MTKIYTIANDFVERFAAQNPVSATGMGVPATRATTAEEFHRQFAEAMSTPGPRLIEAMVVQ